MSNYFKYLLTVRQSERIYFLMTVVWLKIIILIIIIYIKSRSFFKTIDEAIGLSMYLACVHKRKSLNIIKTSLKLPELLLTENNKIERVKGRDHGW